MDTYKTLKYPGEGIYKEKMSKFISFAHPVESAEEAKEICCCALFRRYQAWHVGIDCRLS